MAGNQAEFTIEEAIGEAIEFFSHPENKTPRPIEEIYLPKLIRLSQKFDRGLVLDVRDFGPNLSIYQKIFLREMFPNAMTIKIKTTQVGEKELFYFLQHFVQLSQLTLTTEGDRSFLFPLKKSSLRNIKIIGILNEIWLDPIPDILNNNEKIVSGLWLENVYFTSDTITALDENPLTKLCLKNIIFYNVEVRSDLIDFILNSENLNELKLIFTERTVDSNVFQNISHHFFRHLLKMPGRGMNLSKSSFTIYQEMDIDFEEILMKLGDVRRLDIYYTAAEQSSNVLTIISNIRKLEEENLLKIPDINFIEYYAPCKHAYVVGLTATEALELRNKSITLKQAVIDSAHKYVTVKTFEYEEYYPPFKFLRKNIIMNENSHFYLIQLIKKQKA